MLNIKIEFIPAETNGVANRLSRMFHDDHQKIILRIQLFPKQIASKEKAMIAPVVM
jgi:hypothetical protein